MGREGGGNEAEVVVRALTLEDAAACDRVILSLPYHFGDPGGREECARAVRSSSGLVATRGERVVGFLTLQEHSAESVELTWLAVQAELRHQGIGKALLAALRRQLQAAGYRLLIVFTLGPSAEEPDPVDGYGATRAFYRAAGFVAAKEFLDYWPTSPALLMVLPLGEANGLGRVKE